MPRIAGSGSGRLLLTLVVAVLIFGFTPLSNGLLRAADGSFDPSPYSSLALKSPSQASIGILAGEPVAVDLSNHLGHTETYHWSATENGTLISLGEETLSNGSVTTIHVPSRGAVTGKLRIAITGTAIFITVPLQKL